MRPPMLRNLDIAGKCALACGFALILIATFDNAAAKSRETVLHAFQGGTDGGGPLGGLISDSAGNLYGTTYEGGGTGCSALYQSGCGTIFRLNQ